MSNLKRTRPVAPKGATVMMFRNGKLVGGTVDTLPHLGKSVEAMTSRKR